MKKFIRDYLTFHRREKRGIVVLLILLLGYILYLNFSYLLLTETKTDFSAIEKRFQSFSDSLKQQTDSLENESHQRKSYTAYPKEEKAAGINGERFKFNPNNLPDSDWKRLGLSDRQIHVLNNYQSKGGRFKTKADVKKMYCIKEDMYLSLEPFIFIPEKRADTTSHKLYKKDTIRKAEIKTPKAAFIPVELNAADSMLLITIRGIKGFYAKKIIERRNELGGFVRKEQLMELWKFDQEKYDGVEKQVLVDASKIKKININTCSAKELKHPYLNWNTVNGIISYRTKHGKFTTIEDIKKTDLVDDETYRKIASYLITE